jgi:ferric-dicitrate binding protein FerR (iron transport regulator)
VRVTSNRQTQTILSGEVCELTSAGLIKFVRSDVVQTVSWKQGVFYFEDKPLVSIFDELERQFNVSIKFEGGMDRVMTVSFSNKILNEALDIVCIPMGLEYEIINDKKVRIFQKGE